MNHTIDKKKIFYIALTVVMAVISIVYLVLMFQRGIRYDGYFLRKVTENQWQGNVYDLPMTITKQPSADNTEAALAFTYNGETLSYTVLYDEVASESERIKIYSDETLLFAGYWVTQASEMNILSSSSGEWEYDVTVRIGNSYDEDAWRPTNTQLVTIALENPEVFHAQPIMLLPILFFVAILAVDIIFPEFFFHLRYNSLMVKKAEPSYFYYQMQPVGRVFLCFGIVCLMIMSFN